MKKTLPLRLAVLMAAMMCALGAAAAEAYVCYTPSNTTLTFYYDNQRSSRPGTTYDLNLYSNRPGWYVDGTKDNVTKVVFNSSFAGARPTTTYFWFCGMTRLQSIVGMSYFNTSEVTNFSYLIQNCSSLTSIDVSHFDTSKATVMECMFDRSGVTNLDLSNFNTSNVTSMYMMFNGCNGLTTLDLRSFNTAKVTNMALMFKDCANLRNLNLSSFNTAKVTNMNMMFYNSEKIAIVYVGSGWNTSSVVTSTDMFYNNYALVGDQGTQFYSTHNDASYAHLDGGSSNQGYFSNANARVPYACYTPSNTTLTFYYDNQRIARSGWAYNMNKFTNRPGWYIDGTKDNVTKVVFNSSFAAARCTTTYFWFCNMTQLKSIVNVANFNTSEVTCFSYLYMKCHSLTSIDVSHFDTSKATEMEAMFAECGAANLDLSNFNTSNVTNMYYMFNNCSELTSLNLEGFNTAKVKNMSYLFRNCTNLASLDLSSFNTGQVTNMSKMFENSNKLVTVYVGNGWTTTSVNNSADMFYNCTSIVGGKGTTFNANHIDKTYARIDGGPANPGYFTEKATALRGDVDGSGSVNINDVITLINYLLSGNASGVNVAAADCNTDSHINMSDVTALIGHLLTGSW